MSKSSGKKKKVIKDSNIKEIFAIRDKLLLEAKTESEKENIHMACKGIFACPKHATDAEKSKCFADIRKKLEVLMGVKVKKGSCDSAMGGRKRNRSRSRSKSKSRSKSRSKSKSRSRSRSRR